jgi:hypothetical protein
VRVWIAAVLVVLSVAAVIAARALLRDNGVVVSDATLTRSLARELGRDGDPARCRRGRRFQYRCEVAGRAYRVTFTGDDCWTAVAFVGGAEAVSGCVKEDDQPE